MKKSPLCLVALLFIGTACFQNPDKRNVENSSVATRGSESDATLVSPSVPTPIVGSDTTTPEPKTSEIPTVQIELAEVPDGEDLSDTKEIPNEKNRSKKVKKLKDDPIARIKGNKLGELSGIIAALRPGEYWGHNDRGNDPKLYRFNLQGNILQTVTLRGIENDDWEAISRSPDGNLLIGGFGDNEESRDEYRIYQIPEPKTGMRDIKTVKKYAFQYPDGKSKNAEAFFVLGNKIYLITKEKDKDVRPAIFCIDKLIESSLITARLVSTLAIDGIVTDAAYSPTQKILAVLTYAGIGIFRVSSERDFTLSPVRFVKADFDQCEGICFEESDLIVTNESGEIWRYSLAALLVA